MITCQGWCGLCYANRRGRSNRRGHTAYQTPQPERVLDMSKYLKRQTAADKANAVPATLPDAKFEKEFPALWEFLTVSQWDATTQRITGTLLIFREEGRWKACLNDRDQLRSCFASANTWLDLMANLEDGLAESSHEWRAKRDNNAATYKKRI